MERALGKTGTAPRGRILTVNRMDVAGLLVSLAGFFVGRAVLFQFMNFVGVAYLAAFIGAGSGLYITAIFFMLGLLTKLTGLYLLRYIVCVALICIVNFVVCKKRLRLSTFAQGLAGGVSILAGGLLMAVLDGYSLYFTLLALMECLMVFSLTFIFKKAVNIITSPKRRSILSADEMISVAFLLGAVVTGSADIHIAGVSLRYFFCSYILLICCHKGGSGIAAAAGLLLGFMLYLPGYWDVSMPVILGLCGMTSGMFKSYGKAAVTAGFTVSGAIYIYLMDQTYFSFGLLYSVILAVLVFSLTPGKFFFNFKSGLGTVIDNTDEYILAIKDSATDKLKSFSSSFQKLAVTFNGLSEKRTSLDKKDVSRLIDDLAAKVCTDCERKNFCWDENFYHTFQTVFGALDACEKKGMVERNDLGGGFSESCLRIDDFVSIANRLFEYYKMNLRWSNRIAESRELVSQQLSGVSQIIGNLAEELDMSMNFQESLEESIIEECNKNKVEVDSVIVLENNMGKYEVTINRKTCAGKKNCDRELISLLNAVLKRKMRRQDEECGTRVGGFAAGKRSGSAASKRSGCTVRYIEDKKYRIISGVARVGKYSGESGDSYSFMELKNGSCLLALSDGMGSGKKAREESAATVELLEDFIESGFEKDIAVRIINSVLVLKSSQESFSTLDICSVDLYNGSAEFIKIGAASTFLLRDGRADMIRSASLPMGILNDVSLETAARRLTHNDVIVMVTDGVLDSSDTYDKDNWLATALEGCRYANPQDIADYILLEAKKNCHGMIKDDMTVLAARIWEN